ncbi:beta-ketoacyl-ACP synthase [Corallococcus sp. AB011P]|uniref:beta-ketoacyl-ACP synthase n=1 Tax=unclassified Corallococcus TaxID=2685029 RepID=UPI000EA3BD44|nr:MULTISPECIES: beta-ketoacyl-ACP synthase [unclassified Corallococcus]RKG58910.1 beta-ketoacyl-ACP synthase [Corallococcus sp. AB011P]RKH83141.1 beta-ketoacyl-ACP synthase [Corallococcus sp. AB045]
MPPPVFLNQLGLVCALGSGKQEVARALFADTVSGVASHAGYADRPLHLGVVTSPLAAQDALPPSQHSRNNALLLTALEQVRAEIDAAVARFGPSRVAVVLGTSTSGVGEGEAAIAGHLATGELPPRFHLQQQELGSPALALAHVLGTRGPAYVISTACSSSAKALASAARMLRTGTVDAVLTGGVDSLCGFTVAGFRSLDSVSEERCNPMSAHRHGINIGEAAALFLMTREPGPVRLSGWGESSDAHHISAPEPGGKGAMAAIQEALKRAGLAPEQVDYVNLHGTATAQNDAMETRAVHALLGPDVKASSTKPLTGHTLGAAGALEAAFAFLTLVDNPHGKLPGHFWDGAVDSTLPALSLVKPGEALGRPVKSVLSNSFAFGGSNAALVLERA